MAGENHPGLAAKPPEFIVRIHSRHDATIQGEVEQIQPGQAQQFRSLLELLQLIQTRLDETGCPQPVAEMRRWEDGFPLFPVRGG